MPARVPAPPRDLPAFALYGESARPGEELLHIETIESRSRLYRWEIAPHVHHGLYQVLWVDAGAGEVRLDEQHATIEGLAVVLVPPGIAHGFRFAHGTVGRVLTLSPRFLVESDFAASAKAVQAVFAAPRVLRFAARDAHAVRIGALLAELDTEFSTPGSAEAPVTTWLARAVLWRLGQACAADQPDDASRAARHQALFTRFLLLVEAHFLEHWPVATYASRLGMTPARLNRLTRTETGRTALELIHARVTREACRRLIYVAAPVAKLAQELGFEDPAYFCRFFKRATGSTPHRYRQQLPG